MINSTAIKFLCSKMEHDEEELEKNLIRLENARMAANSNSYNGIKLLKNMYYRKYIIKAENINKDEDSYVSRNINDVISRQKVSLDMWLDYLLSDEVIYPEWFKYFIFQGVIKFGEYDELNEIYKERDSFTIVPFIKVDYEVIAFIYNNLIKYLNGEYLEDKELESIFRVDDFSSLYNYSVKKVEYSSIIEGKNEVIKLDYEINKALDELNSVNERINNLSREEWHITKDLDRQSRLLMKKIQELRKERFWILSLVKYDEKIELRKKKFDKYSFWIFLRNSNVCVGEIDYRKFHLQNYLGDIGYTIYKDYRRNGYALAALELLSEKLYEDNIPSFLITTYDDNKYSKRVIEKYGGKLLHTMKHEDNFKEKDVLVFVCETRVRDDLKKVK